MEYNFEKVGKETVLKQLEKSLKGKIDFLQAGSSKRIDKLKAYQEIEDIAKDARVILESLGEGVVLR